MTTKKTAQELRRAGRNGDTQLVHMTRSEVAGLGALAKAYTGKSLPRNPKTGLPEANLLKQMLPTILGAAASFVGTPALGAAVGAAAGAAMNPEDRWGGAALGAMGGYGGGQLAQGLTAAGANAAAGAAGNAAAETAAQTAVTEGASQGVQQGAIQSMGAGQLPAAAQGALGTASQTGTAGLGSLPSAASATPTVTGEQLLQNATAAEKFGYAGQGVKSLGTMDGINGFLGTEATKDTAATGMGGGYNAMMAAGKAAAPAMMAQPASSEEEDYGTLPKYRFNRTAGEGYRPGTGASSEQSWFNDSFTRLAEGGAVPPPPTRENQGPMPGRGTHSQGMSGMSKNAMEYLMGRASGPRPQPPAPPAQGSGLPALAGGMPAQGGGGRPQFTYDPSTGNYTPMASAAAGPGVPSRHRMVRTIGAQAMAAGGTVGLESGGFVIPADVVAAAGAGSSNAGMEALARKLGAQPISGPGDGQSDSIPASIDGKHKARVARDEMFMTREQVEAAGGAKKLYAMMDRIRAQATGSKKQMRPVKLDKAIK